MTQLLSASARTTLIEEKGEVVLLLAVSAMYFIAFWSERAGRSSRVRKSMLLRRSWLKRADRTKSVLLSRLESTKATAAPETTSPGTTDTISSIRPKPRAGREGIMRMGSVRTTTLVVFGQARRGRARLAEQAAAELVHVQVQLVGHLAGRARQAQRALVGGFGQRSALGLDHHRLDGQQARGAAQADAGDCHVVPFRLVGRIAHDVADVGRRCRAHAVTGRCIGFVGGRGGPEAGRARGFGAEAPPPQ